MLKTRWGRVTHKFVGKLTIIGSDNGLSPGRRQAIIWTNAGILLIGPLYTNIRWNFNRNWNILDEKNTFENVVCDMLSISLGLNVLNGKTDTRPAVLSLIMSKVVHSTNLNLSSKDKAVNANNTIQYCMSLSWEKGVPQHNWRKGVCLDDKMGIKTTFWFEWM